MAPLWAINKSKKRWEKWKLSERKKTKRKKSFFICNNSFPESITKMVCMFSLLIYTNLQIDVSNLIVQTKVNIELLVFTLSSISFSPQHLIALTFMFFQVLQIFNRKNILLKIRKIEFRSLQITYKFINTSNIIITN